MSHATRGVVLMTYGSPSNLDDVERYITAVRGGRAPDEELIREFRRRYEVIGLSPLIEITVAQAAALERELGDGTLVRAGMRFSEPSIGTALGELRGAGVREVAAIILSPQYSPLLMGGYQRAVDQATADLGADAPRVELAGAWHLQPAFIGAVADRIREALGTFSPGDRTSVPVLLTAHSLPKRVAEVEPGYLDQLRETAEAIAAAAGLGPGRWRFCWQSAGHEPGEWMKPDFADLMPELGAAGHQTVLVAPVQFLADHLEVLYDVDVGAREQAELAGLEFRRIASLNVAPRFIEALAAVARATLARA
jgi:protoporphyrin/coproporphyrin ferrochelatase